MSMIGYGNEDHGRVINVTVPSEWHHPVQARPALDPSRAATNWPRDYRNRPSRRSRASIVGKTIKLRKTLSVSFTLSLSNSEFCYSKAESS